MVYLCNTVNWLHFLGIVAFELRWFVVCLAEGCVWVLRVYCLFKVVKFITPIVICYFGKLGNNKSSVFWTRENLPTTGDTFWWDYLGLLPVVDRRFNFLDSPPCSPCGHNFSFGRNYNCHNYCPALPGSFPKVAHGVPCRIELYHFWISALNTRMWQCHVFTGFNDQLYS